MDLPITPPVKPMLAKLVPQIPPGQCYEPKWDGFRSIVFRDGDEVEIGSRNERPMTRYFPEVADAVRAALPERIVVDGEIVIIDPPRKVLDFEALQLRLHPAASRVATLSAATPATFVAFDLLALGDEDLTGLPFEQRRALLEGVVPGDGPVRLTPLTREVEVAQRWFVDLEGAGMDGVIAKDPGLLYLSDKRVMSKVKHSRTADFVVGGMRPHAKDPEAVGSLMLGLYDDEGGLASVGVIGAFPMARRRELYAELSPLAVPIEGHPWDWSRFLAQLTPQQRRQAEAGSRWNAGKDLSFVPLAPQRVVEGKYDYMEGRRLRHTAQFVRWRPDREPRSCTFEQLERPETFDVSAFLGG